MSLLGGRKPMQGVFVSRLYIRSAQPRITIQHTFDRHFIKKRWRRMNLIPLERAGLYVRRVAINSIKSDKTKPRKITSKIAYRGIKNKGRKWSKVKHTKIKSERPSRAMRPPKTRSPGNPMRRIYSALTGGGSSAIVGPVIFPNRKSDYQATSLHEYGGTVRVKVKKKRYRQGIKRTIISTKTVVYPKRPYMLPALLKGLSKFPQFWSRSLHT